MDSSAKPDRFCLGCEYPIHTTLGPACPECGRSFDPADPSTYATSLGRMPRLGWDDPGHISILVDIAGFVTGILLLGSLPAFLLSLMLVPVLLMDRDMKRHPRHPACDPSSIWWNSPLDRPPHRRTRDECQRTRLCPRPASMCHVRSGNRCHSDRRSHP